MFRIGIHPFRDALAIWAVSVSVSLVGFAVLGARLSLTYTEMLDARLQTYATIGASMIDGERHNLITKPEDTYSPLYNEIIAPLVKLHSVIPQIYFAYTVVRNEDGGECVFPPEVTAPEDKVCDYYFVLDTTEYVMKARGGTPNDHEPPIMSLVRDASPQPSAALIDTLTYGRSSASDIYTSRFGTFKSGFAPIYDNTGTKPIGVVAIDMHISDYTAYMSRIWRVLLNGEIAFLILSTLAAALIYFKRLQTRRVLLNAAVERKRRIKEIQERTIENERLLRSILPGGIVERLRGGEELIADNYERVSVVFIHVGRFAQISTKEEAISLIPALGTVYDRLNELTVKYQLEKIKSNGSFYVVAGGFDRDSRDQLVKTVKMALETMAIMREAGYEAQIGISAGAVIAGVIGHAKFTYDLWGRTVIEADALARYAQSGRILCSGAFVRFLDDMPFSFIEAGDVRVNDNLTINAYELSSEKQEKADIVKKQGSDETGSI
ncbi:MAG: adenylate/guanylate cyclase domain-containing protein [Helicobacteraceae bacterium]|jgi:class 3 adenylate cyclase|nr:adenylate/guanylate cyclase domain-containing protein [Helicobacteraceae bacterium]